MNILICVRAPFYQESSRQLLAGAMDAVMQLTEETAGISVFALSLNEPGAEDYLRECLAHAAEKAFLIHAISVEAEDITAAGQLFAEAVQIIEHDNLHFGLIVCLEGDPALDGLGAAIAGSLNRPYLGHALTMDHCNGYCLVQQRQNRHNALIRMDYPCIISFLPKRIPSHYPDLDRLFQASCKEIPSISVDTIPPKWEIAYLQEITRKKQIVTGNPDTLAAEAAKYIWQRLIMG